MTPASTTMDFFESQDKARKRTVILTLYFVLAVLFIIFGVYVALLFAWSRFDESVFGLWHPGLFIGVTVGVIFIVTLGSVSKITALSKGGEAVAQMLGAIPIDPNTADPYQRKLLNVVEEMAIASGVPVPSSFLLQNEDGINAFAAGLIPGSAVITVTRGCMERLTRDELQGVIAHEFSHILNGDMRLNVRLIGIIAGILVVGVIGRVIVRSTSSRRSRSSGKKGGGAGVIVMMGLIIMAVGYIGVFFGKLIRSAVSRQREFLADASAVQFTRNPMGITGALKKIAGLKTGSRIHDVHAEEASHLFFCNGLAKPFLALLATHPPIKERIRRIDPSYRGREYKEIREVPWAGQKLAEGVSSLTFKADVTEEETTRVRVPPDQLTAMVGAPQSEHLAYASQMVSDLHPLVAESAREPFGARALIYCLLLNEETNAREIQWDRLNEQADRAVLGETKTLMPIVDHIGRGYRLSLVDLAIPTLKLLSSNQYGRFRVIVKGLAEADKKISLFEYTLQRIVLRNLDPVFRETPLPGVKYHVVDQVLVACFTLLSTLAWRGSSDAAEAQASFERGMADLDTGKESVILAKEKCGLKALDVSLDRLAEASPQIKKKILKACIECIHVDARITVDEVELLRAVASSLDCPIPPIIPMVLGKGNS
jgi:Zn-dependent protease with chaperone function